MGRLVFPAPARELEITVGLVVDLGVINPFDFFVEEYAETFPFTYDAAARRRPRALPRQARRRAGAALRRVARRAAARPGDAAAHRRLPRGAERGSSPPGSPTRSGWRWASRPRTRRSSRGIGSCRDSAWLLVEALRHFGLAARFVSGYLVQLASDDPAQGGPTEDFTDLHAWAEVYVPGAGWIGLDATSGAVRGRGPHPAVGDADPGLVGPDHRGDRARPRSSSPSPTRSGGSTRTRASPSRTPPRRSRRCSAPGRRSTPAWRRPGSR